MTRQKGVAEVEISALLLAAMILSWALIDLAQPGYQQQRLQQLSEDLVWLVSAQRNADDFDVENNLDAALAQIDIDRYQNLADELWPQREAEKTLPGIVIQRLRHNETTLLWNSGNCTDSANVEIETADINLLLAPLNNGQRPAFWVVTACLEQQPGLAARWFNTGGVNSNAQSDKAFPTLIARSILVERNGN